LKEQLAAAKHDGSHIIRATDNDETLQIQRNHIESLEQKNAQLVHAVRHLKRMKGKRKYACSCVHTRRLYKLESLKQQLRKRKALFSTSAADNTNGIIINNNSKRARGTA
jgi:cysteine sulfinate desulfinase/cysteine desulfurase-like protein